MFLAQKFASLSEQGRHSDCVSVHKVCHSFLMLNLKVLWTIVYNSNILGKLKEQYYVSVLYTSV